MRLLLLITSALFLLSAESDAQTAREIKISGTLGYVFPASYESYFSKETGRRFTPSLDEIKALERALKRKLKHLSKPPKGRKWNIRGNLKKYVHQYFGFFNSKGEKVIAIECHWRDDSFIPLIEFTKGHLLVEDGGPTVWEVKFNLTTGELSDFSIGSIA